MTRRTRGENKQSEQSPPKQAPLLTNRDCIASVPLPQKGAVSLVKTEIIITTTKNNDTAGWGKLEMSVYRPHTYHPISCRKADLR